jgi:hypothetical protein
MHDSVTVHGVTIVGCPQVEGRDWILAKPAPPEALKTPEKVNASVEYVKSEPAGPWGSLPKITDYVTDDELTDWKYEYEQVTKERDEALRQETATEAVYQMNRRYVDEANERIAELEKQLELALAAARPAINDRCMRLARENEALRDGLAHYLPEDAKWDTGLQELTLDGKRYQPMGTVAREALAEADKVK